MLRKLTNFIDFRFLRVYVHNKNKFCFKNLRNVKGYENERIA